MKREKYQAMKKAVEAKRQARAEAAKTMPAVDLVKEEPAPSVPTGQPKKMKPPRRPFAADAEIHQKGRFPAGTKFAKLEWDGEVWVGHLDVPNPTPADPSLRRLFALTDTAVHRLLVRLYAEYRKWADAQPKEVPGG